MEKIINRDGFKVGDTVVRFKGGTNEGKDYKTPFVVSSVNTGHIYDESGHSHNSSNCMLVTPKSEIVNDYNIF